MSYGIYGYGGKTTKTGALRPIDQLLVEGGRRRGCFHPPYIPWLAVARLRVKFMKKFNPCQGDSCPARESRQGGCQRSQYKSILICVNHNSVSLPEEPNFKCICPCAATLHVGQDVTRNTKHSQLYSRTFYCLIPYSSRVLILLL